MGIRLTGLSSGLDTETIIKQLVDAKKTKVDSVKKEKISAQYKQDAWKGLNTKLKNLMSKYVSNLRWSSAYAKKTTAVSNSNVASVITGDEAMNGVQSLRVEKLAKTAYLTGAQIKEGTDGEKWTALSKISDVSGGLTSGTITINTGSGISEFNVTESTTISDVLTAFKDAGLNANFDSANQRFFVSAGSSGEQNNFSITASDSQGEAVLSSLGLKVNLSKDETALKEYTEYAGYYVDGDKDATVANMSAVINSNVADRVDYYLKNYKSLQNSKASAQSTIDSVKKQYEADEPLKTVAEYDEEIERANERIKELNSQLDAETDADAKHVLSVERDNLNQQITEMKNKRKDASTVATQESKIAEYDSKMADIEEYVDITSTEVNGETVYSATAKDKLTSEIEDTLYKKAKYAASVIADYDPDNDVATGATKVKGQDAVIYLNDAMFTGSTNTISVNGLTITALSETAPGETVTITTKDDTDGIYDMIKDFIKEYNSIVNEMDKLYNAASNSYEPLLDDEKKDLSDSEVEKWEEKIKEAILRKDDTLNTVNSALQSIMAGGINVNGKTMYLSDFGISPLSYFSAADNEKHAYHIDGDTDDAATGGNADKLKSMIASDPDTVISFFSQLGQALYEKMNSLSSSVDGYRSFGSFYNDKKMTSDYNSYESKITEMESKLQDYEDKWYDKFAKMETALAKLQSNTSAVTSLLGGN